MDTNKQPSDDPELNEILAEHDALELKEMERAVRACIVNGESVEVFKEAVRNSIYEVVTSVDLALWHAHRSDKLIERFAEKIRTKLDEANK